MEQTEREKLLDTHAWEVEATNWRELGEVVASFNHLIGAGVMKFDGVATYMEESGFKKLTIELVYCPETDEGNRCVECHRIPDPVTFDNPGKCVNCFGAVCDRCTRKHRNAHYKPMRTIGGDVIEEKPPF